LRMGNLTLERKCGLPVVAQHGRERSVVGRVGIEPTTT
jgi:hypothetical protein